jgi:hypothetical protein
MIWRLGEGWGRHGDLCMVECITYLVGSYCEEDGRCQ